MKKRFANKKGGFTLVELVIVIAVLAILATIAIPTITNVINSANTNTDLSNAQQIEAVLKEADAQIQSKTYDASATAVAALAENSKVREVLKAYGVTISEKVSGTYDTQLSGNQFYYCISTKKIVAAKSQADAITAAGGIAASTTDTVLLTPTKTVNDLGYKNWPATAPAAPASSTP